MPKRPRKPRSGGADASATGAGTPSAAATAAGATVPPLEPGTVAVHEGLAVIEVADPADLAALLADPRLAEYVLARIGGRAAVVLPQVAPLLLLAMAKAGQIPTIEGEP